METTTGQVVRVMTLQMDRTQWIGAVMEVKGSSVRVFVPGRKGGEWVPSSRVLPLRSVLS